jgi:hypothetical protein
MARHLDAARNLSLGLQLAVLVGGGVALSLGLGTPFGMAWANFLPTGTLVVLAVLARRDARTGLARLGRELAEVYVAPLLPFAAAWLATPGAGWLRFAATGGAAVVSLGWTWYRHGPEFRAFFSRSETA